MIPAVLLFSFSLSYVLAILAGLSVVALKFLPLIGMTNEIYQDRPDNAEWFPCPSAVTSGMPVLIGRRPAVALDAYDSNRGGTTFRFTGTFSLTVIGQSQQSPNSIQQINPGDRLFASGTLDATTNVTYNLTIDATRGNIAFGSLGYNGGPVLAGQTQTTAYVKLLETVGVQEP